MRPIAGFALSLALPVVLSLAFLRAGAEERPVAAEPRPLRIVLDPGHGGADHGAKGASGLREKDVALAVARHIGERLAERAFDVHYTRDDDRFVSLAERTEMANQLRADFYLSIHANASPSRKVSGPETYFVSLEASDDEARRVAMAENQVFDREEAAPGSGDLVAGILGDLIRTEHLRASSEVAKAIQHEFERLPGPARGVKQAPFVVLMGVNMPAALIEIGFLTNAREERELRGKKRQGALAAAVTNALVAVREARALTAETGP